MAKKQIWGGLLALFLAGSMVTGCTPEPKGGGEDTVSQDSTPVMGDWVRIYHSADPDGLHPFNARNGFATSIKENVFMYLADFNSQTLEPEPTLAKSRAEVSADGLSFTFEMRPEAKWDNGDPITGEDYAFSVKCLKNPLTDNSQQRSYYNFVQDVKIDPSNPKRFTVVTNRPFFLAEYSISGVEVLSHAFYDSSNVMAKFSVEDVAAKEEELIKDPAVIAFAENFNSEKYSRDPAFIYGSGAYKVESWTAGDNVTLVRKKDWWGDQLRGKSYYFQAYVDKLIFKTIKEKSTLPAVAKNGELDVLRDMSPDDFVAAREDSNGYLAKNFNFHTPSTYAMTYLGMNTKPGPGRKALLDDVRVRQAISHLVDTKSIIANVYNGFGESQIGPISPLHKDEYDSTLVGFPFDPAKAEQMLDEAGWKDTDGDGVRDKMVKGKKIKLELELLISNSSDTGPRMARIFADQAQKAGVTVNINKIDFGTLSKRIKEHDFDMYGGSFGASPLPTDLIQLWSSENWANGGSNYCGFGNAETDSLIEQIRQLPSAKDRTPLYHKFQKLWLEQLPMVIVMSPIERILIHKRFHHAVTTSIRPGYKTYEFWVPKADQKFK